MLMLINPALEAYLNGGATNATIWVKTNVVTNQSTIRSLSQWCSFQCRNLGKWEGV